MDETPSMEQSLESDLKTLADGIRNNREKAVEQNYSEQDLVKEAIRAFPNFERPSAPVPVPQPSAAPAQNPAPAAPVLPNTASPLPDYAQNAAPEVKLEIEYLLDLALTQGLGKALTESGKSPYFVQDAFHDALAGKLYPELQKRGIVK
ncbi:MAG: hypothetical protein P4L67_00690 [Candidatus Pacebacteria bacterium]|nr:hypothetical protein [Candidatus Paceibacterota bacterium]